MAFRKDFIWGAATAAYQIEGAAFEDGKGPCVWDEYSHTKGKVLGGDTGDIACDHYHRYKDDAALLKTLGIPNYRFSVCWPRLMPEGKGPVNQKGVDFYSRLIDELLKNGVRPFMTLFHWEYPLALARLGGWENPDSPKWFADYAQLIAERYGDRVKDFITLNEPQCFIGLGYGAGEHAPGRREAASVTVPMSHHVLHANGLAARVLKDAVPDARVGYAPTSTPVMPLEAADTEKARALYFAVPKEEDGWYWNVSWWSDPAILGRYPDDGLRLLGQYLPVGWEKDMAFLKAPLDFYCQNIYQGRTVRACTDGGYEEVPHPVGGPKTAMEWPVTPDCLYWSAKFLYERYRLPYFITENGMSGTDWVHLDGSVHDAPRIDYLHRHLRGLKRAAEEGADVAGYFQWSFLDNFEWAKGYSDRFGLVYVDYKTQQRIPKDSAYWYKEVIASNGENL